MASSSRRAAHFPTTKAKRRVDPGQEKAKEDRRRKRLAKALKKMEKKERQPKPLSECEVIQILDEL